MHAVGPKIIASYHSKLSHIDFIKSASKVFATSVVNGSAMVVGDSTLLFDYTQAKQRVQQLKAQPTKGESKNREELAQRLLSGHLHEFRPDLSQLKEEETAFNVKKELYRPFQELLNCQFYKIIQNCYRSLSQREDPASFMCV